MCTGEELPICMARTDELDADRQAVRAPMGGQRERGRVQNGPDCLKGGIAGSCKPARSFSGNAGREQDIHIREYSGQLSAAFLSQPQRLQASPT